jgi:entericidin B
MKIYTKSAAINIHEMACRLLIQTPSTQEKLHEKKARKEVTMLRRFLTLFMTVGILGIAACNTVHGLGQDIERGGEKTQDAADAVKKKL